MSNVLFEVRDGVGRVTLNRPASMNAVDGETEQELLRIWAAIEADRGVRIVVLTGAGDRAFCAGSDMKNSDNKTGLEYWAAPRPDGFGGIALRQTLDVPVLARVNGFALGGGFEMVLGCDIVVACDDATFGLPEARVGRLPLDGGMTLLQRRRVPAREALALGIVNEVVPRSDLDSTVDRWVQDVLACAPLSVRAIKQVVRRAAHLSASEAQAQRLPALIEALESEDSQEGVLAFREKRAPAWKGR